MKIFVTGAAGFVGGHTVRALLARGHEVVGLVRTLPDASRKASGAVYVTGDVTDAATLPPEKLAGCEAVVHLVGIIQEVRSKGQTFEAVHVQGTRNVLAAARAAGVSGRFVYLSAIGSDASAASEYSTTKARAEQAVKESGIPYTIFRPSVLLGPDGEFVHQMEDLMRKPPLSPFAPPFVPVPGNGKNRFQPLWIGDLTHCIARCLEGDASANQSYEIGGGSRVTFNELLRAIGRHIGVKKPLIHAPMPAMFAAASVLESVLPVPPVTTDQLLNLQRDSICDNTRARAAFGLDPLPFEQALARVYAERRKE